ncbi:M23 family metallopeptidase [Nocardioides panacisoli]|uniref:M23 family metallopeptidase n=1 Tax=Nocardioides panacisoli TaxID=627624 RepID=UPI001C638427|nr:M23 family metallopeptidase [Nocardioides panacisoli]QYJ02538.1 M23 family metallopeptidase [Nocardioides panacisoli]
MGSHRADQRSTSRARRADRAPAPTSEHHTTDTGEVPTVTAEIPVVSAAGGKRRALKHVGRARTPLPFLPSLRAAVGVTVLAVAAGGVVTAPDITTTSNEVRLSAPSALLGSNSAGTLGELDRGEVISRNGGREAEGDDLVAKAEEQAAEREARLGQLAEAAQEEAGEIAKNAWVTPLTSYRLTATFGEYGLWSSAHTGLDFAAPYGTPIRAVAGGTVTEAGYDGSYGNKTVVTLEDGTELWYAHQSSYGVSTGDEVRSGEVIGYVGSTGNSTGSHLHLEVRPGGGDPVDPYRALVVNGVQP